MLSLEATIKKEMEKERNKYTVKVASYFGNVLEISRIGYKFQGDCIAVYCPMTLREINREIFCG